MDTYPKKKWETNIFDSKSFVQSSQKTLIWLTLKIDWFGLSIKYAASRLIKVCFELQDKQSINEIFYTGVISDWQRVRRIRVESNWFSLIRVSVKSFVRHGYLNREYFPLRKRIDQSSRGNVLFEYSGKRKEIHCLKSKSNSETSAKQNGKRLAKCNFQFIDKNLIKRMSGVI